MASGSSPGPASPSLGPGAAEVGRALGEWKGKRGRARLEGRSPAKCAERCGRLPSPLAVLRVPAAAGGFWKEAREALDSEASMRQITDLVLCPCKEPFSLGAPSTRPKRGRGQPRDPDLSASGSRNGPQTTDLRTWNFQTTIAQTDGGQNHLRSFEECTFWGPTPGRSLSSEVEPGNVHPSKSWFRRRTSATSAPVPAALLLPHLSAPATGPRPKVGVLFPGRRMSASQNRNPGSAGPGAPPGLRHAPLPSQARQAAPPPQPSTHTFSDDFQQILFLLGQLAFLYVNHCFRQLDSDCFFGSIKK